MFKLPMMGAAGVYAPPSWDLLDEPCDDFTTVVTWSDNNVGDGASTISPAGQFKFDSGSGAGNYAVRKATGDVTYANLMTVEVKLYHDALGTFANVDQFYLVLGSGAAEAEIQFASDGLYVYDGAAYNEVCTNLVQTTTWQVWRFTLNWTTYLMSVYLDTVLQASGVDFSSIGVKDSATTIVCRGEATANRITHMDYFKMATRRYPS